MITHIVCFRLKDRSDASLLAAKEMLLSMRGKVEQLREIEVGTDFLHSDRSYDVCLRVLVDDAAALEAYQNHPYHVETVKKYMHEVRDASIAVDYEMDSI